MSVEKYKLSNCLTLYTIKKLYGNKTMNENYVNYIWIQFKQHPKLTKYILQYLAIW